MRPALKFSSLAPTDFGARNALPLALRHQFSTFGHSNACRQSRRADCGLLHACLRSSAACAFCGVLCVLDGFVMKCPKLKLCVWTGPKSPGSVILVVCEVHYVARWVRFYGARSPFWPCSASSCFACRGATIIFTRAGGRRSNFLAGERRANMIVGSEQKKTPRRAPCMQISSQEGERRVCDARALRSGPPCRT